MNENSRLDRIEEKLDRVVETLQMLARIDERQDAFEQRLNRHELRIDLIEKDVNDHGEALAASTGKGLVIERAAWIIFAAVVSSAAHFF